MGWAPKHNACPPPRPGGPLGDERFAARRHLRLEILDPNAVVDPRDQRYAENPGLFERDHLAVGNRAAMRERKVARRSIGPADGEVVHGAFLSPVYRTPTLKRRGN